MYYIFICLSMIHDNFGLSSGDLKNVEVWISMRNMYLLMIYFTTAEIFLSLVKKTNFWLITFFQTSDIHQITGWHVKEENWIANWYQDNHEILTSTAEDAVNDDDDDSSSSSSTCPPQAPELCVAPFEACNLTRFLL